MLAAEGVPFPFTAQRLGHQKTWKMVISRLSGSYDYLLILYNPCLYYHIFEASEWQGRS